MKPAVLITGACGGIGRALCEVFHEAGYAVVGIDKDSPADFSHTVIPFNLQLIAQSDKSADALRRKVFSLSDGRLDVLINNAAVQIVKPCDELTREDWHATLDTNLLAPFWLTTLFLPELRAARGCVVNIGSIHAKLTKRQFVAYATSKGALEAMTRAMALDLAPDVRVNAIAPAATDTPMLRAGFVGNSEGFAELNSYHPLGRIARCEEIAQSALFVAGSQSAFMTGVVVAVDGGISSCLSDPAH
ncbi:SDR family NAD(P)-dependent oxidoreductase [Trichlorobacter ammonificans]|uniref:Glucose 1-dehydrogenase 2 n=1 Tax=Trichlorobacter ammonificans TaxID=2916410 RepID=A0ABN8HIW8_9BACT|nr:SDR family oxidoreductase [Trichlorobacter ammonificans]CAH2029937.1 putative Glucose 1-dehydrogenase 2 [Trichlorobacter ammonificans]